MTHFYRSDVQSTQYCQSPGSVRNEYSVITNFSSPGVAHTRSIQSLENSLVSLAGGDLVRAYHLAEASSRLES